MLYETQDLEQHSNERKKSEEQETAPLPLIVTALFSKYDGAEKGKDKKYYYEQAPDIGIIQKFHNAPP